jgi:Fe-S-cluster containining protein
MSFNCAKCPGFCCSHGRIEVSEFDVKRLAGHFELPLHKARRRFTYVYKAQGLRERILRHHRDNIYKSICMFFDRKDRKCTVYEARPRVCRQYPYGDKCGYYDFLKFERAHSGDPEMIPDA